MAPGVDGVDGVVEREGVHLVNKVASVLSVAVQQQPQGVPPSEELNAFLTERGTAPVSDGAPLISMA